MIEQRDLQWYLSVGITVFERSTSGAILDKLDRDAHVSRPCPVCDHGIVTERTKSRNSGRICWVRSAKVGDWCKLCKGVGSIPVRLSHEEQLLAESGDWASGADGGRACVPDGVMIRYAFVSRVLCKMPPRLRRALESAWGDEGEELAAGIHGRSWACSHLTPPGETLLAQERRRRTKGCKFEPEMPIRALTELARINSHSPNPERTELLAGAAKAADALLREAEAVWDHLVSVAGGSR